jgi:DNA end-binding protein Ku
MHMNPHPRPVVECVLECDNAPPRAYWTGHLKLALVSCPIALSPATSGTERVSWRQINTRTGNRLRRQLVDDVSREPVGSEHSGKGFEVAKGEYLHVADAELEAIKLASTHTIEIDRFVPAAQIDKRFYDSAYYVSPNNKPGVAAFAVIRDAMRGKGMVALGRVVLGKRERVIALEPHGRGLLGTTLYYPYEVRKAEEQFDDIPDVEVPAETRKLAEHLLDSKAGDFDPSQFKDRYEDAVVALIREKQVKLPAKEGSGEVAPSRNVNVMDELRRSIAAEKPDAIAKRSSPAKKRA